MSRSLASAIVCIAFGAFAVAPLFSQALPPAPNRPERIRQTPVGTRVSWGRANSPALVVGSGPLPPKQGHEGPEVFSIHVRMHALLKSYLSMYSSPPWLAWLSKVRERAQPFLGYIESRIAHYGLPPELRFLPIAESSYDPFAVSKAGAAGLWQLMPKTGHAYGLDINRWVDQRFNFWSATDASLLTLRHNYKVLGNWLLALAAYDAGLGLMQALVASTGIHSFWRLAADGYLPHETVDYVPRFLAIAAICSYPGRYGLPLSWRRPLEWTRVRLRQPVNLRLLADQASVSRKLLAEGNAGLRYGITPPGRSPFYLQVPAKEANGVEQALHQGKNSLMFFYVYPVRAGDTLYSLGRYYGVPISMIEQYNPGVTARGLKAGSWLLIPAVKNVSPYRRPRPLLSASARLAQRRLRAGFTAAYTVRNGDTLWSIAVSHGTTAALLAKANGISEREIIQPGLRLRVPPG